MLRVPSFAFALVLWSLSGSVAPAAAASPYVERERHYTDSPVVIWRTTWCQPKYFEQDQVQLLHYLILKNEQVRANVERGGMELAVTHTLPNGESVRKQVNINKIHVLLPNPRINKQGEPAIRFNDGPIELGAGTVGKHRVSVQVLSGLTFRGHMDRPPVPLESPHMEFEVVTFDPAELPETVAQPFDFDCYFEQWRGGPDQGSAYWPFDLQYRGDEPVVLEGFDAKGSTIAGRRVLCIAGCQRLVPDYGWHWGPCSTFCGTGLEEFIVDTGKKRTMRFYEIRDRGIWRFSLSYRRKDEKGDALTAFSPPFVIERRGLIVPAVEK
jgi:hypothetical protein